MVTRHRSINASTIWSWSGRKSSVKHSLSEDFWKDRTVRSNTKLCFVLESAQLRQQLRFEIWSHSESSDGQLFKGEVSDSFHRVDCVGIESSNKASILAP